jgi:hypothetical protein
MTLCATQPSQFAGSITGWAALMQVGNKVYLLDPLLKAEGTSNRVTDFLCVAAMAEVGKTPGARMIRASQKTDTDDRCAVVRHEDCQAPQQGGVRRSQPFQTNTRQQRNQVHSTWNSGPVNRNRTTKVLFDLH